MRAFLIFCCILGITAMLCSCGRRSKPQAPKDSFYPHTYIVEE